MIKSSPTSYPPLAMKTENLSQLAPQKSFKINFFQFLLQSISSLIKIHFSFLNLFFFIQLQFRSDQLKVRQMRPTQHKTKNIIKILTNLQKFRYLSFLSLFLLFFLKSFIFFSIFFFYNSFLSTCQNGVGTHVQ